MSHVSQPDANCVIKIENSTTTVAVPPWPTHEKRQKFYDAAAYYCIFHRVFESFGGVFNIPFRERTYTEPTLARAIKNLFPTSKAVRKKRTDNAIHGRRRTMKIPYTIVNISSENTRGNSAHACFSRSCARVLMIEPPPHSNPPPFHLQR